MALISLTAVSKHFGDEPVLQSISYWMARHDHAAPGRLRALEEAQEAWVRTLPLRSSLG